MNGEIITPKAFMGAIIVSCVVLLMMMIRQLIFRDITLTFCDVGQGDGAYIRMPTGVDIVIDGGPNDKILECLGKKMPFYDRTIELAFITHPQLDHFGGFTELLRRYTVKRLIASPVVGTAPEYRELLETIRKTNTKVESLYAGDTITLDTQTSITMLWPQKSYVSSVVKKKATQDWASYETDVDPNLISEIFIFKHNDFQALFTGDATVEIFDRLLSNYTCNNDRKSEHRFFCFTKRISVLKVPHHGSKNALSPSFISFINPEVSVISVGRKNRYGHPSQEVLDYFKATNHSYFMTSTRGDIDIIVR